MQKKEQFFEENFKFFFTFFPLWKCATYRSTAKPGSYLSERSMREEDIRFGECRHIANVSEQDTHKQAN